MQQGRSGRTAFPSTSGPPVGRVLVTHGHAELSARTPTLPVHALGYSLGAMVTVSHLVRTGAGVGRMVLLAPPFALTRTASLVRALTPLAGTGLALPSAAPRPVRARTITPLSEYAALLSVVYSLQQLLDADRLGRIPTRVLIDPRDELVSAPGVERWVAENELTERQVSPISERVTPPGTQRHLLVTEQALGARAWDSLTRTAADHLSGGSPPSTGEPGQGRGSVTSTGHRSLHRTPA